MHLLHFGTKLVMVERSGPFSSSLAGYSINGIVKIEKVKNSNRLKSKMKFVVLLNDLMLG